MGWRRAALVCALVSACSSGKTETETETAPDDAGAVIATTPSAKAGPQDAGIDAPVTPREPARIRNRMPNRGLRAFAADAARKAAAFPDAFFIEGQAPGVALTFDDGPDADVTDELLAILAEHGAIATFFLVGDKVARRPDLAQRIAFAGHAIGGHGYKHVNMAKLTPSKAFNAHISATQAVFADVLGFEPSFYRPPYGAVTDEHVSYYAERGLATILWSVDSLDWQSARPSAKTIASTVLEYVHDGAIVLLHEGASRRSTLEAIPVILEGIAARGLTLRTVPELLGLNEKGPR